MVTVTGEIVTPQGVLPGGALVIDDAGRIAEVAPRRLSPARSGDIDAAGLWVLPGFVDMHVHGGGGADFMHGTPEAVRQFARTHARFGTTGLLATTLTASRAATDAAIQAVRDVRERGAARTRRGCWAFIWKAPTSAANAGARSRRRSSARPTWTSFHIG